MSLSSLGSLVKRGEAVWGFGEVRSVRAKGEVAMSVGWRGAMVYIGYFRAALGGRSGQSSGLGVKDTCAGPETSLL